MKSREFWKVPKINFFWLEWCQNRSKCSSGLKFWSQALKSAKFWDFWSFLAIFVVFDHIWKMADLGVPAVAKSEFSSQTIKGDVHYSLRLPKILPVDVKSAACELAQNQGQIFGVPSVYKVPSGTPKICPRFWASSHAANLRSTGRIFWRPHRKMDISFEGFNFVTIFLLQKCLQT